MKEEHKKQFEEDLAEAKRLLKICSENNLNNRNFLLEAEIQARPYLNLYQNIKKDTPKTINWEETCTEINDLLTREGSNVVKLPHYKKGL